MATIPLYTTAQTRELDRIAIEEFGIPGIELMEKAGRVVFDALRHSRFDLASVGVLCGRGNNGGDGYVIARLLHEAGMTVRVISLGEPSTADAQEARKRFLASGGRETTVDRPPWADISLVVDALLGSGLGRAPKGAYAECIRAANAGRCPIVSVDLPSGLSGDTGHAFDPCIRADLTVTFIGRKVGQFTADGPDCCGALRFADLDLDAPVYASVAPMAELMSEPVTPLRTRNSHKGQFGHLVIAGGEPGMRGAILLAGRAGLRGGAGRVTVLSDAAYLDQASQLQPELMTRAFDPDQAADLLVDADAVVFGPGTTDSHWSRHLFRTLSRCAVPVLLDAGALHLLAVRPDRQENRVLTPHPGEAAVLLGGSTAEIQRDRPAAAAAIQERYGGVCVLKGAGTIIQGAAGITVCDRGNPGMATAGMGDVLSGLIGGLLAQGLPPWEAARQGVWWHAVAGDLAETALGERSLIASDVIDQLPHARPTAGGRLDDSTASG